MDGLNHGFSVCTINGAILKNHVRNWNVTTTSGRLMRISTLLCCRLLVSRNKGSQGICCSQLAAALQS